ncbi:TolC family protein, partial [Pseudomonas sp. R62]|uniref:TolC family protein n=1 Tax=Pseudomonas sp. R62 TaxID=1144884 RepID=UPI00057690F3
FDQNKQALNAAERGYQQGATDYLSVLTAQLNVLSSQTRLNASSTEATLTLVNLYKSLGGGWNPDIFGKPVATLSQGISGAGAGQ